MIQNILLPGAARIVIKEEWPERCAPRPGDQDSQRWAISYRDLEESFDKLDVV